ncbi:MAG: cell division protein ZapA [Thermotogota bacterium]
MKRKITITIGRKNYSFLTDESKEKVQRIKDIVAEDYEKFAHVIESTDKKGVDDLLILMLLNHVSKEIGHEEALREQKEKNERLVVELERMKTERGEIAG